MLVAEPSAERSGRGEPSPFSATQGTHLLNLLYGSVDHRTTVMLAFVCAAFLVDFWFHPWVALIGLEGGAGAFARLSPIEIAYNIPLTVVVGVAALGVVGAPVVTLVTVLISDLLGYLYVFPKVESADRPGTAHAVRCGPSLVTAVPVLADRPARGCWCCSHGQVLTPMVVGLASAVVSRRPELHPSRWAAPGDPGDVRVQGVW